MKKLGVGVCFPLVLLACCLPEARAIKRKPSLEARDHPEAVVITAKNTRDHRASNCSGALLTPSVVLTAAHCVDGDHTWDVLAPYAPKGPARSSTRSGRTHPKHKEEGFRYDLAVLILDTPIDLGDQFPTLNGGELYPIETRLLVVGCVEHGTPSGHKLFKTVVTLVPFPDNVQVYGGLPQVVEKGDSGGPVYAADKERELVAVVSGHSGFSSRNVPTDLYVPVSAANRGWLLRQIRGADR